MIDLEGLANHAGSAFGWVGREPQPTSEHYSNLVACEWHELDPNRWVYIEDEGPHVGRCSVDPLLFERMRNAPLVLRMVASRDIRLRTLVKDYATSELRSDPQWLPTMRESVDKLAKRLGGDRVREIQSKLDAGDFAAVAAGLLEYYDGLYDKHLMSKRKDRRHAASDKSSPKPSLPPPSTVSSPRPVPPPPLSTPVSDDARSVKSRAAPPPPSRTRRAPASSSTSTAIPTSTAPSTNAPSSETFSAPSHSSTLVPTTSTTTSDRSLETRRSAARRRLHM